MSLLSQATIPAPALRLRRPGQLEPAEPTVPMRVRKPSPVGAGAAAGAAAPLGRPPGRLAVGNLVLQIGHREGALVDRGPHRPAAGPAAPPQGLAPLPAREAALLGREADVRALRQALASSRLVEVSGGAGIGKTACLQWLAQQPAAEAGARRAIYCLARYQPAADVRQALYTALCHPAAGQQPTESQMRRGLQAARALILLDDVTLEPDEIRALVAAAPGCAFAITVAQGRGPALGPRITLGGLRVGEAVRLLERELGRPLAAAERPVAQRLCFQLHGYPGRIVLAAALLRAGRRSLPELQFQAQDGDIDAVLSRCALEGVAAADRNLLAAIAAGSGVAVPAALLAQVGGLGAGEAALARLQEQGLVLAGPLGYTVPAALRQLVRQEKWDLPAWRERLASGLLALAENCPERLPALPAELILALLAHQAAGRQWPRVLHLARAAEAALILTLRWGAWGEALRQGLQAARQTSDAPAEAWLLHQAGTRALCLGEAEAAQQALNRALSLRRDQREHVGAAVTRHNLGLLELTHQPRRH